MFGKNAMNADGCVENVAETFQYMCAPHLPCRNYMQQTILNVSVSNLFTFCNIALCRICSRCVILLCVNKH